MPVNEAVVEALATTDVLTVGSSGSAAVALSMQNQVAHHARLELNQEAALGRILADLNGLDHSEVLGLSVIGQIASKTAGNTPPTTP